MGQAKTAHAGSPRIDDPAPLSSIEASQASPPTDEACFAWAAYVVRLSPTPGLPEAVRAPPSRAFQGR
jgi:hypothetical protein